MRTEIDAFRKSVMSGKTNAIDLCQQAVKSAHDALDGLEEKLDETHRASAEKAAAAKSKAVADKRNEVNRAPFKPKRASKGVPFQPKKSDA